MPEPDGYVAFADYIAQLLADADGEDCERLDRIDRRSLERIPCPAPKAVRRQMSSFEIVSATPYNQAGAVYYTSGAGGIATMILYRDASKPWSIERLNIVGGEKAGNSSGDGAPSRDAAIDRFKRAVLTRDCNALGRLFYQPPGSDPASCKDHLDRTQTLAAALRMNPDPQPAVIGADRNFGFHSLSTAVGTKRIHHVFTVIRAQVGGRERYLILDFFENEFL